MNRRSDITKLHSIGFRVHGRGPNASLHFGSIGKLDEIDGVVTVELDVANHCRATGINRQLLGPHQVLSQLARR